MMSRRGFTILELMATMALLGTALTIMVPLLQLVGEQRRAAEKRQLAQQEVANLLEQISAKPWDEVTQKNADGTKLSQSIADALSEPQLKITVTPVDGEPASKRIAVELRWKNRQGDYIRPARLTCYVYRREVTP